MKAFTKPFAFTVNYSASGVTLESQCPENKRLPKYFALDQWDNGKFEEVPSHSNLSATQFPYDLKASDMVFDNKSTSLMTLKEAMETNKASSVFGFTKSLKPAEGKAYAVQLDEDTVSFLLGAKTSGNLVAAFGFKLNADKKLEPTSLGVYLSKMTTFVALEKMAL